MITETITVNDIPQITSWHSYPKIYNLGHNIFGRSLAKTFLLKRRLTAASSRSGDSGDSSLPLESCQLNIEYPEKMFKPAIETAKSLDVRMAGLIAASFWRSRSIMH